MEQLGVADSQGLAEARQLWQDWVEQDSRLASAPAVDVLQDWLMLIGIDAADEVLHALVKIGSPTGKDCRPAAWVVAWALLPGAIAVTRRAPGIRRRMRWSPASSGWKSGSSLGGGTRRSPAMCWRTYGPLSLARER